MANQDQQSRSRPFSYQLPPDPPSSHRDPASSGHSAHPPSSYQAPAQQQQRPQQSIQTTTHEWAGYPEQRFSYVETPIEDSTQTFDDEERERILQQARQQYGGQETQQPQATHPHEPQQQSHYHDPILAQGPPIQAHTQEKNAPARMPSAYQLAPPAERHPALVTPVSPMTPHPFGHYPQRDTVVSAMTDPYDDPHKHTPPIPVPPHSPGPIPIKTTPADPSATTTNPQAFSPYTTATAPPDLHTTHRPGQIPHPNMAAQSNSTSWTASLCSCAAPATCLLGLACPCILYSRLAHRLARRSARRDPTDLLAWSACDGQCLAYAALCFCGVAGLLAGLARGRVRSAYKLDGNVVEDCFLGCCCACCALTQSEREILKREKQMGRWAGPGQGLADPGYKGVDAMRYQAGGA